MALFIRQNENQSKLQQKLVAELQEKARKRAQDDGTLPSDVEDTSYLKDTKKTTSLAWLWVILIVFAIGLFIAYIIRSAN